MKNANLIGRAFNEGLDDERSLANMKAADNTNTTEANAASSPVTVKPGASSSAEQTQPVESTESENIETDQLPDAQVTETKPTPMVAESTTIIDNAGIQTPEPSIESEPVTPVETPETVNPTQSENTEQEKPKPTNPDDLLADNHSLTRDELMQIKSSLKQTTLLLTEKTWKNIKIKCLEESTPQAALLSTAMYQVFVRNEIDLDPELIERFATMFDRHRK